MRARIKEGWFPYGVGLIVELAYVKVHGKISEKIFEVIKVVEGQRKNYDLCVKKLKGKTIGKSDLDFNYDKNMKDTIKTFRAKIKDNHPDPALRGLMVYVSLFHKYEFGNRFKIEEFEKEEARHYFLLVGGDYYVMEDYLDFEITSYDGDDLDLQTTNEYEAKPLKEMLTLSPDKDTIEMINYCSNKTLNEMDETNFLNSTEANLKERLEKSIGTLDLKLTSEDADLEQFTEYSKAMGWNIVNTDNFKSKETDRVYNSGAKRSSNKNKPFIHNFQAYSLLRFGYLTNMGAREYGDGNFLKGFPDENAVESLLRHITLFRFGDESEDHLASALFNIQLLMLNQEKRGIKVDHWFKKSE